MNDFDMIDELEAVDLDDVLNAGFHFDEVSEVIEDLWED